MKKFLFIAILPLLGVFTAHATTNCDDQAKPAIGCPTGYSMMCSPVGGNHWSCGKEAGGIIIEDNSSTSAMPGIKSTMQTQVMIASSSSKGTGDDSGTARLLPTVNKINDDKSGGNSERLLPTVNKKNGQATVRGWDMEKKEMISLDRHAIDLVSSSTLVTHLEPGEIQNTDDLKALAEQTMKSDDNIKNVSLSASGTEISYDVPGKLFWLFPIHVTAQVQVTGHRVKVRFPWLRIFFSGAFNLSDDGLNSDFSKDLQTVVGVKPQDELQIQAQEFQAISNVLKTRHDAS